MRLSQYLEEHDLTDAAFAEQLAMGVTGEAVRLWRLGRRYPRAHHLHRIVEVTDGDVTPSDLIPPRAEPPSPPKRKRAA